LLYRIYCISKQRKLQLSHKYEILEMHRELWYRSELDGSEKCVHAPVTLHLALPTRLNEP